MNMPTFIEVPIRDIDGRTVLISLANITSFGETDDGRAVVTMADSSAAVLDIPFHEFVRMLRIAGCRLLTHENIDLIGESGEEDISI